ncbi:hypothetical protein Pam5_61 [Pseudanabaena phage Pam5]|nr:hypothetical protein Pam5_61 [Pseudanabaena phage Pam5]
MTTPSNEDLVLTVEEMEAQRIPDADTPTLEDCVKALHRHLPGFWWRGGTCGLSSEVVVAPDYNCKIHGERLVQEFPQDLEHWADGIDVEIRPGSDVNLRRAFVSAILRARLAINGVFPEPHDPRDPGTAHTQWQKERAA